MWIFMAVKITSRAILCCLYASSLGRDLTGKFLSPTIWNTLWLILQINKLTHFLLEQAAADKCFFLPPICLFDLQLLRWGIQKSVQNCPGFESKSFSQLHLAFPWNAWRPNRRTDISELVYHSNLYSCALKLNVILASWYKWVRCAYDYWSSRQMRRTVLNKGITVYNTRYSGHISLGYGSSIKEQKA
jgi:hypothetical protein